MRFVRSGLLLALLAATGAAQDRDEPTGDVPAAVARIVSEAERLEDAAKDLIREGRLDEAEERALEAIDRKRRALGRDHVALAPAFQTLCAVYLARRKGRLSWTEFAPILHLSRRALALLEAAGVGNGEAVAESHIAIATGCAELGYVGGAGIGYLKAYQALEGCRKPGDERLTWCLETAVRYILALSPAAGGTGLLRECAKHAEALLARTERSFGEDHAEVAKVLRIRGLALLTDEERHETARSCLERALSILRKAHGPAEMELAGAHLDAARQALDFGDLAAYRTHFAAAQEIWRKNGRGAIPTGNNAPWESRWIPAPRTLGRLEVIDPAIREHGPGSEEAWKALNAKLVSVSRAVRSRRWARDLVAARRTRPDGGGGDLADGLRLLGEALLDAALHEEAEAVLTECVKITERVHGKRSGAAADAHAGLGFAYCRMDRLPESSRHYQRALYLRSRGKTAVDRIETLRLGENLARVSMMLGDYEAAHEIVDSLTSKLRSDEPLLAAIGDYRELTGNPYPLGRLRDLCRDLGRHEDDRYLSIDMGRKYAVNDQDPEHFDELRGDYRSMLRRARDEVRKGFGRTDSGNYYFHHVSPLVKQARALLALGCYDEGLADLLLLIERLETRQDSISQAKASLRHTPTALSDIAEQMLQRGAVKEAVALASKGYYLHLLLPEITSFDRPGTQSGGLARNAIFTTPRQRMVRRLGGRAPEIYARALCAQGQLERAIAISEDNLAFLESRLPAVHRHIASAEHTLSRLLLSQGERERARSLARAALTKLETVFQPDHPALADILLTLGDAEVLLGDHAAAEASYRRALQISRSAVHETHLNFVAAQSGIAMAMLESGRPAEALKPMRAAVELVRDRVEVLCTRSTARERLRLMASVHWVTANWLAVSRAAGQSGYDEVVRLKGYVGRLLGVEQRMYRGCNESQRALYDELIAARSRLTRLAYDRPRPGWPRLAWRRRVAAAAEQCHSLGRKLRSASRSFKAGTRQLDIGRKEICAELKAGEALIDVILAGGRYTAWVCARTGPPARVELGPAKDLDPLLLRFRDAVSSAESSSDPGYVGAGAELGKLLWDPIAGALPDGTETVYLVPDATLYACPLPALPGRKPGTVLADEYVLIHLTAAQELVPIKPAPKPGRSLVIVGDVDYFQTDRPQEPGVTGMKTLNERIPGSRQFSPLPATKAEVDTIAKLWTGISSLPLSRLERDAATEHALREAAKGCRILHLATHGFVREKLNSALRMPADAEFRLRAGRERYAQGFDPMLLSGLALAGANARVHEDDDDGILTALEVMTLDLAGCDLAVLSACESARGVEQAGEGVSGLVRGFRLAGARGVVASLWPVGDESTLELMKRLYARLLAEEKPSPTIALREANRELRVGGAGKKLAAPRYWAAFVCFGPQR